MCLRICLPRFRRVRAASFGPLPSGAQHVTGEVAMEQKQQLPASSERRSAYVSALVSPALPVGRVVIADISENDLLDCGVDAEKEAAQQRLKEIKAKKGAAALARVAKGAAAAGSADGKKQAGKQKKDTAGKADNTNAEGKQEGSSSSSLSHSSSSSSSSPSSSSYLSSSSSSLSPPSTASINAVSSCSNDGTHIPSASSVTPALE